MLQAEDADEAHRLRCVSFMWKQAFAYETCRNRWLHGTRGAEMPAIQREGSKTSTRAHRKHKAERWREQRHRHNNTVMCLLYCGAVLLLLLRRQICSPLDASCTLSSLASHLSARMTVPTKQTSLDSAMLAMR
eukprot:4096141-Amphidinium_carterae.1